jgi:hypothetical protein
MASVKRYQVYCSKCQHQFAVFAAIYHTVNVAQWLKEKADNHDCKAHGDAVAKAREPRPVNPLKASKKS